MTRTSTRTGRRAGFTIAETLMALGIFSVIMLGIGAALAISVRAIDDGSSASARTAQTGSAACRLAAELGAASTFSLRDAHAVEFTVPDRTGDGSADLIRYEWSTNPDGPITRTLNGGTAVSVIAAVNGFDLSYLSHTSVARATGSSTSTSSVALASFSTWTGVTGSSMDYRLSSTSWAAEYVPLDSSIYSNAAAKVSVGRVTVWLRGILATAGSVTAELHRTATTGSPAPSATLIGSPVTVNMPLLSLAQQVVYGQVNFDFTGADLDSSITDLVILFKGSGTGVADLKYLYSTSAPADTQQMEWTTNSGSGWNPTHANQRDQQDLLYTLTGTSTSTTSTESLTPHYFLDTVGVRITPGSRGGESVQTMVRVVNAPEVPSP